MKCPRCQVWAEVLETRVNARGKYRRYQCANLHRFSSQETFVDANKVVDAPVTPRRDSRDRFNP